MSGQGCEWEMSNQRLNRMVWNGMEWSSDWGWDWVVQFGKVFPDAPFDYFGQAKQVQTTTRRRLCRMSVYFAVSLFMWECVSVCVCVCGFLCRCLSAVLLHVVGWLVVVKATVPAPDKPDRQMDTHTSIIIINSMKGNSDSNGDGGNLLALTVLCSAVFHEVCNIFYACAAGGDCETTAIKKREETYN